MGLYFIILIPCSWLCIYKWEAFAFYSQLPLIYLSKQVHLQSALSVVCRQSDTNKAVSFISLSSWWATRGSIDFRGSLIHFFPPHFLWITMRDTLRELAGLSDLSVGQFLFYFSSLRFFFFLSSYLGWPQELLLSEFNAPYSVDSISIKAVTTA